MELVTFVIASIEASGAKNTSSVVGTGKAVIRSFALFEDMTARMTPGSFRVLWLFCTPLSVFQLE